MSARLILSGNPIYLFPNNNVLALSSSRIRSQVMSCLSAFSYSAIASTEGFCTSKISGLTFLFYAC